jgi:hypothetical protein
MSDVGPRQYVDPSTQANGPNRAVAPRDQLGAVVGRWRSDGHLVADPNTRIRGTDTYVWLPGNHCLVHYVDVLAGEAPVQPMELITPDPHAATFTARSYDNAGMITTMAARFDPAGVWTFTGGPEVATAAQPETASPSGGVRSRLIIADDRRSMHADWERTDDGSAWEPWMKMGFTLDDDPPVTEASAYQAVAWAAEPATSAPEELQRLAPLAGRWRWTGRSRTGDFAVSGETDLRWLPGGHFLVERGALESAGEVNHSLAVTGWNEQRRDCVAEYVDSNGEQDTYRLGLEGNDFTIDWARFRFAGRLDETGDLITGTWQQSPDRANWEYWYDAELRRM